MSPAREERLIVADGDAGQRLDVFLAARLPTLSRSRLQALIRSGHVLAAGAPTKPGTVVTSGLIVTVSVPEPTFARPEPENLPLSILYDDEDLVVIDKPAGMVVHPAAGHARGTLVNALLHHVRGLSGVGGQERPGLVHRLDRGTSGVMVIAKHDRVHQSLSRQFHDRTVTKEYVALVWGRFRERTALNGPIGRDPRNRLKMSTRATRARPALTQVMSIEALDGVSLLHITIGTGRTHQIRVHLSEAGHPVVGDELYGGIRKRVPSRTAAVMRLTRPFLHASRLTFTHPGTDAIMSFDAPLPPDLVVVLDSLRRVAGR